jgi:hypothetical protein
MGSEANEDERWEEHQEFQDPMGNTRPRGQSRELQSAMRVPGYGVPLSHHDRHALGAPSLAVASDARSAEESMDFWRNKSSDNRSTSSDRKRPAMPDFVEISQMPPPPPRPSQPTIEISPGVHVRLRGAEETWKAVENDFYMPAECMCCESMIFCIQNADYVLCPDCRVVSRMEGTSSSGMGGVGLGFKYEDLSKWQEDILRDQQSRRSQAHFR